MIIRVDPATTYNQLSDELDSLLHSSAHYLDENSFLIKRLKADAQKLMNADAALAYLCFADIGLLVGDRDGAERNQQNAFRLSSAVKAGNAKFSVPAHLANLGYFSEAQKIAIELTSLDGGFFSYAYNVGIATGAIRTTYDRYLEMESLKMERPRDFPIELIEKTVQTLSKWNISDEYIAELLDKAGEVMREEKRFDANRTIPHFLSHITDPDGNETVVFTLLLKDSPENVAKSNSRLMDKLAEIDEPIPNVININFGVA